MYLVDSLEQRAKEFASLSHFHQKRKYSNLMYIVHPEEVVSILKTVPHTEYQIAAGWLHDVVEDCGVTNKTIRDKFGWDVSTLVEQVTNVSKPKDGSRKLRVSIDLEHLKKATSTAQTIKLADIISNVRSIITCDPDFAKVWVPEKIDQMYVLTLGDSNLWAQLMDLLFNSGFWKTWPKYECEVISHATRV
jgi:(p)ppGpp synthase/HD superfamily hydrolase